MNNEPPQTLSSFDPSCYSQEENLVPCVSKPNFVDESSNVFNPPPQPPIYSCEFYGSNAQYGHYSTPQVWFIYPKPGYSQEFDFLHNFHDFNNSISVVISVGTRTRLFNVNKDEHLDTIMTMESDKVIKSSVEDLVPIPSESEGIPDTIDADSVYNENIKYVEASPHDSELVSLEAAEIVIPEVKKIEDDNLREKLLNVHILIDNIEALKDDPTQSFEFLTKSSSTSPKYFLEETNTFHNSLPEFEN
nr:hypothetical protein [Tanacetum cinerariifolium]